MLMTHEARSRYKTAIKYIKGGYILGTMHKGKSIVGRTRDYKLYLIDPKTGEIIVRDYMEEARKEREARQ